MQLAKHGPTWSLRCEWNRKPAASRLGFNTYNPLLPNPANRNFSSFCYDLLLEICGSSCAVYTCERTSVHSWTLFEPKLRYLINTNSAWLSLLVMIKPWRCMSTYSLASMAAICSLKNIMFLPMKLKVTKQPNTKYANSWPWLKGQHHHTVRQILIPISCTIHALFQNGLPTYILGGCSRSAIFSAF